MALSMALATSLTNTVITAGDMIVTVTLFMPCATTTATTLTMP